jgi:hypothetical protein
MTGFKFNKVFAAAVLGLTLSNAVAPALAAPPANQDACYVQAGGAGWSFYALNAVDGNEDGIADNHFMYYSRTLTVIGNIDPSRSVYDAKTKKTILFGASSRAVLPAAVKIEVTGSGGTFGWGTATVWMHRDLNNNRVIDANEPMLTARPMVIHLTGLLQTFK